MGRWIPEECGKIVDDTSAFLGRANGDEEARALCEIHNADRDAYEKRIAELEALVRRVNEAATCPVHFTHECFVRIEDIRDMLFRHDKKLGIVDGETEPYETEASKARAELARVKAESLRVVEDGEACELVEIASGQKFVVDGRSLCETVNGGQYDSRVTVRNIVTKEEFVSYRYGVMVQPVRLVRLEDVG